MFARTQPRQQEIGTEDGVRGLVRITLTWSTQASGKQSWKENIFLYEERNIFTVECLSLSLSFSLPLSVYGHINSHTNSIYTLLVGILEWKAQICWVPEIIWKQKQRNWETKGLQGRTRRQRETKSDQSNHWDICNTNKGNERIKRPLGKENMQEWHSREWTK